MKDEFLKYAPLFSGLNDSEREALSAGFTQGQVDSGSPLFRAGEQVDCLYLIGQGFVRVATEGGQVLATLGPGSILADVALFRGAPNEVTATAVSPVEYWTLSDRALRDLVLQQPSIGIKLGQSVGAPIVQMEEYLAWRLSKAPELQRLPQNTVQAVASLLRPYPLPAGEPLFRAGEPPRGIGLLESGAIELRGEGPESPQTAGPGAILGALALLTNKPYMQTALATEESLIWALSADDFHAVNSRHPGLRRSLAHAMKARLSRADQAAAVARLQEMPLFAEVPPPVMQQLAQRMVLQHVPAGDRVYRVGEAGDALYLVEQGEVELTAENAQGIIEERARIGGNGFFGEMSVLTGQVRIEDATATRNTNLWVLYKSDLDAIATQNPPLGKALSQAVATRLAATAAPEVDDSRYRAFELFAGLSATELRQVAGALKPTRYRAGETIFRVNAPGEMMYFLERGQVRIQPISGGSYVLGPGDEFGERSLLSSQPHNATALAETDADIWTLSRTDFSVLTSTAPALAINLSRTLSQRLGQPVSGPIPATGAPPGAGVPPRVPPNVPPYLRGNAGVPPMQSVPRSRGQAAPIVAPDLDDEYEEIEEYPLANPPRAGFGAWFNNLTPFGKLRFILLILLLLWLLVAIPWAVLRLLDLAFGTQSLVAAANPAALEAVYERGSYDVALGDASLAQAIAAADQLAAPTPTWTPHPTPTPSGGPTPQAVAMAAPLRSSAVEITTELMNLGPVPQAASAPAAAAPVEAAAAEVAPAAAAPAPAPARERVLDARLGALGVQIEDAQVAPGEPYWRLIEVRFADEQESAGKHHIYVDVIDENGARVVGQPVTVYWGDGYHSAGIEDKPAPDFGFNYQMYASGFAYNVKVEGLPSDLLKGAGMGDVEQRFMGIHTSYYLLFQRAIR